MKNILFSKYIITQDVNLKLFNNLLFLNKNNKILFDFSSNAVINTYKKKIQNQLISFKIPFLIRLVLPGVGYRIEKQVNNILQIRLGYSHFIYLKLPDHINFFFSKKKNLILSSYNLEELTLFVSQLKKLRKFDKYKGKGFLNKNQKVTLKIGKKKK